MRYLFLTFFLVGFILQTLAQNQAWFFKTQTASLESNVPEWAKLMYENDPNVAKVDAMYRAYFNERPFVKDLHVRNYLHWRRTIQDWISEDGKIRIPSQESELHSWNKFVEQRQVIGHRSSQTWESLGPVETYQPETLQPISWQANVYSIAQSKQNKDLLIVGTEAGGIYKTENKGISWEQMGINEPIRTAKSVAIHPKDDNHFIVTANRYIFQSKDRGQSWDQVHFIDGPGYEVVFLPDQADTIYCAGFRGLFRSEDGGNTWHQVFQESCWDLVVHPTKANVLYLLKTDVPNSRRAILLKSTDSGYSWETKSQGWYNPQDPDNAADEGGKIAVSPADPSRVYAALIGQSKPGDSGWIGFFRSDDEGETWYNPSGQIGGPYQAPNQFPWNIAAYSDGYHQGFYNFSLAVSAQDADRIWIGTIRLSESSDGGNRFTAIGAANSRRHNFIHADIQYLLVQDEEIWIASDGGVDYSNDELQSHESRKKGIIASDYWGFGSGWNEDVLFGGKYHNGNGAYYQTYGKGNYLHVGGVEEPTGYVNPLDNRHLYYNRWWTQETASLRIPDQINGRVVTMPSLSIIPNENYVESSSSGIYFHPQYVDHMFIGSGGSIWKSIDGGARFDVLFNFGDGEVYEIEISRKNPDLMYAVYRDGGFWSWCKIYKSTDGGQTWEEISEVPADRWRLEISLSPQNDLELWVACSRGQNGAKVFRTLDGGSSWENMTASEMDEQRMMDVFCQAGVDNHVYLATNRHVFHWDGHTWVMISEGLPLELNALQFKPFYRDGKLRLSTYGWGIWEIDLIELPEPSAQILTHSPLVSCARDTVLLSCHSVLFHEGAKWNWTITPEPVYLSETSDFRIMFVPGESTSFSVQLDIEDALGNKSSQFIPDIIQVEANCDMEGDLGLAATMQGDGDFIQIQDLGLNSTELTVCAWVKPNGIQNPYSAIFMADGNAAGFNFINNNELGYHWPGGAWWWESGLVLPENEWSHVAMVVQPDGITLYLNGQSSSHVFTAQEASLAAAKLGSYQGWGGRNFSGEMDEISIWNRALDEHEIRSLRHLTLAGHPVNQDLWAYYQFNEPTGRVNDKVGVRHGTLRGSAARINSSAPAGPGFVDSLIINNYGTYEAIKAGVQIQISDMVLSPITLYVSQIQATPSVQVPHSEDRYWIVNAYGLNDQNIALTTLSFKIEKVPNSFARSHLWQRPENSHESNWQALCEGRGESEWIHFQYKDCDISLGKQWILEDPDWTTPSNEKLNAQKDIVVFPNPVIKNQELLIRNESSENGMLTIFNSHGKMIHHKTIEAGITSSWPISSLPSGTYLYQWRNKEVIQHGSFIVNP